MVTKAIRTLAVLAVLLASFPAHSTVYRLEFVGGDTVGVVGLNDAGTLLMGGFGDRCGNPIGGAMSAILPPPYRPDPMWQFVRGLPTTPEGYEECGVNAQYLNSAGDMIGTSDRNGVRVPTFWRDGIAYDLRDPANASLVFVPDPGVRRVPFDFERFDIVNLSDFPFLPPRGDWDIIFPATAWTNAGGLFAFTLNTTMRDEAILIPLIVAEPPSIAIVMVGIAAIPVVLLRKRPKRTELQDS